MKKALFVVFLFAVAFIFCGCWEDPDEKVIPVKIINFENFGYPGYFAIAIGESYQLNLGFYPKDATDKNVIWFSGFPQVATIDQNGLVTAVNAGFATITVQTKDERVSGSCTAIVPPDKSLFYGTWTRFVGDTTDIETITIGSDEFSRKRIPASGFGGWEFKVNDLEWYAIFNIDYSSPNWSLNATYPSGYDIFGPTEDESSYGASVILNRNNRNQLIFRSSGEQGSNSRI